MVWDEYVEFLRYFDDQLEFVGRLREDLRSNLVLRLHYESLQLGFNEVGRWKSSYPEVRIDMGQGSIERLWADSRLVVHSYDSTGLLECLAANTPSIAFWQNGLEHVMDDALPYYRLLVDAGIVHLGPLGAADKVAAVWEDVDEWWRSDLVQEARMEFAGRFARTSPNLPRDFARLVKESL
jgi:putative transferase (TIGR04331 family)